MDTERKDIWAGEGTRRTEQCGQGRLRTNSVHHGLSRTPVIRAPTARAKSSACDMMALLVFKALHESVSIITLYGIILLKVYIRTAPPSRPVTDHQSRSILSPVLEHAEPGRYAHKYEYQALPSSKMTYTSPPAPSSPSYTNPNRTPPCLSPDSSNPSEGGKCHRYRDSTARLTKSQRRRALNM